MFFEQGEWDKCIETCELAVERGRELRADFKIIAKYVSLSLSPICINDYFSYIGHMLVLAMSM